MSMYKYFNSIFYGLCRILCKYTNICSTKKKGRGSGLDFFFSWTYPTYLPVKMPPDLKKMYLGMVNERGAKYIYWKPLCVRIYYDGKKKYQ